MAASTACWSLIGGSRTTSLFTKFSIRQWAAVSCPRATKPVWPACWVDIPDRSASSSSKVQDIWDICNEELGVVPPDLIFALGAAFQAK